MTLGLAALAWPLGVVGDMTGGLRPRRAWRAVRRWWWLGVVGAGMAASLALPGPNAITPARLLPPSVVHPLGTDPLGRDVAAHLLAAAPVIRSWRCSGWRWRCWGCARRRRRRAADDGARDRIAAEGMERVVLSAGMLDRHAAQLSGGQRQRAALARLPCLRPRILLLNEPTSALDAATALELFDLTSGLRRADAMGTLMTTNGTRLAACAGMALTMRLEFFGQLR